jgi:hypothetical protein
MEEMQIFVQGQSIHAINLTEDYTVVQLKETLYEVLDFELQVTLLWVCIG